MTGTKAPPMEITHDNSFLNEDDQFPSDQKIGTPPRILTLDKYLFPSIDDYGTELTKSDEKNLTKVSNVEDFFRFNNDTLMASSDRSIINGDSFTLTEELAHLRKQLGKLHSRVRDLEKKNENWQQKERYVLVLLATGAILKFIFWLKRD